jgi:hypothetical protein
VVPYAYRHSYAQRHADEGVPPDVQRDLMGHDSVQTTVGYYRVTEKRVRAAIDRVRAHRFDGQGSRQANLDLKRVVEERDEELAAARETNRRLMNQLNRPVS